MDVLSPEQYLIKKAQAAQSRDDPYEAKAWIITAKALFPQDFLIQFEAYMLEKNEVLFESTSYITILQNPHYLSYNTSHATCRKTWKPQRDASAI